MNPYQTWKRYKGTERLLELARKDWPVIKDRFFAGWDTETTGLHIIKDKPFLFIFGWMLPGEGNGRVFTFNPTQENMEICYKIAKKAKLFFAQNAKYDVHMMENIGLGYHEPNLCDLMAVSRLSLEAKPEREGGDSLALKALGVKYVHPEAANSEKMVKAALKELNDKRIKHLTALLKQFPLEGELTPTGKQKYWGKGAIEKFLKDPTNDIEDLPEDIREIWLGWQEEYPEPTYADVPRETMDKYAAEDVITMLELVRKFYPIVEAREQVPILEREMEVMHPIWEMERVGMQTDQDYLLSSRKKMKQYIIAKRQRMYALAGAKIDCNQHEEVKNTFRRQWGIELTSSDKAGLKKAMEYGGEVKEYAKLVTDLRTLEKWYSTYIERILAKSSYDGRFYTQINLEGAVSGRMSSDLQQLPKNAILDDEGNEMFHPRRAFVIKGNGYNKMAFIDYDQIELVVTSNYTLLVSGGDLNLCRAYMPFKCKHYLTGEEYQFKTKEQRDRWNELQPNGDSAWLIPKTNETWVKTDVHAETTHKAFPHIPLGTPEFKKWRSKGKIFNFLANYGGGKGAAIAQLDLSEDEADALVKGYSEAFPHVKIYQTKISEQHARKGYVHNWYGRRYYLQNNRESYKLSNYNIQGTCADALKVAIIRLTKFIKEKKLKTRFVMPIHDECAFDVWEGEEWALKEFERIMASAFEWSLVPVTAGIETTSTTWKEKK